MASISPRKTGAVCFVFIIILLWCINPLFAQEAVLTHITVSNTREDLLFNFTLEGSFTEKLKEAIISGVPATFTFYVSLHRIRSWWPDKKIANITLTHTIKYDNLKKNFTIKRSWKEGQPIVTHSFSQAQKWMTVIDAFPVYPLKKLEKGRQYQIRAKAEVSKLTLPLYLHYILFSLWDVETDWYTIDFIY